MSYLDSASTRHTPQSEPIPGSTQIQNEAGGFAWQVSCWTRLRRFLILGAESGTYYVGERELVAQNATAVAECLKADGVRTVNEIVTLSVGGRAPKNDPALFALAMALSAPELATRQAAALAVPAVARIGTHLFHLARYVELFGGWGPVKRRAFASWYSERGVVPLAYQLVKYRQRDGYTHRDILRLAHPAPTSAEHVALYGWLGGHETRHGMVDGQAAAPAPLPEIIGAYERAQKAERVEDTLAVLEAFPDLPRECLRTEHLNDPRVWAAMLPRMPLGALIRNLPTMTRHGLLTQLAPETAQVAERLTNGEALRKARVHPLQVLVAQMTYGSGHSERGSATWTPVQKLVDALDASFYASFGSVEKFGGPLMLALDVSGSMGIGKVAGMGLTPRVAAAAMALVTANVEPSALIVGFTSGRTLSGPYGHSGAAITELKISPRQRLDDVVRYTASLDFGGTDCALPMLFAMQQGLALDGFATYTDSETWAGSIHPTQALEQYRQRSGRAARAAVVGMVSNGFSIADVNDPGQIDVVGFDTATPGILTGFFKGEV